MAKTEPDPMILSVAEAVADGLPVDWPGVAANRPELAGDLGPLKMIERVAEAYRAVPDGEQNTSETTVTAPAAALPTRRLLRAPAAGLWYRIMLVTLAGALLGAALWLALMR